MIPTIGRIVHYRLAIEDVVALTKGRIHPSRMRGNPMSEGDVVPMIVIRVYPDEFGPGLHGVNGQAFLDGNDSIWITSAREEGEPRLQEPGTWSWPERIPG